MLTAARLFFALLALTATGRQLLLHVQAGHDTLNFFSYFTNLSNLFASLVLLLSVTTAASVRLRDGLRFISVVNMTVVGLVFAVLRGASAVTVLAAGGALLWAGRGLPSPAEHPGRQA